MIIMSIGNAQISILLLCFPYVFVELMITMNEYILFKPTECFEEKYGLNNGKSSNLFKALSSYNLQCLFTSSYIKEQSNRETKTLNERQKDRQKDRQRQTDRPQRDVHAKESS